MLRIAILLFLIPSIAAAENTVQLDLGLRGGLALNSLFQPNQACFFHGCGLPEIETSSASFTAEKLHGTAGLTASIFLYDHVEVRFEAVRQGFGYQIQRDGVVIGAFPLATEHVVVSMQGHLWQYPLLATYRFSAGRVRPFAGGGLSLRSSGSGNDKGQFTETQNLAAGPVTTTSSNGGPFDLPAFRVYYIVGGVDVRTRHLSIRPELRYSRFPDNSGSGFLAQDVIFRPNQFEVLVGISVHAFHTKK